MAQKKEMPVVEPNGEAVDSVNPPAKHKRLMLRVSDIAYYFSAVLMCIQIVVLFYMVVARYIIGTSATGTDQICLLCMVWYSMLTLALGIIDGTHMRVELIDLLFKKKPQVIKVLDTIWLIVITGIGVLMVIFGYRLASFTAASILPSLDISKAWLYIPLPVSGVLLIAACIDRLVVMYRGV